MADTPAPFFAAEEHDRCHFDIVGESYRRDNISAMVDSADQYMRSYDGWDKLGMVLWLIREPDNPHDSNAIGVWGGPVDQALQVGHIDRQNATEMATRIR